MRGRFLALLVAALGALLAAWFAPVDLSEDGAGGLRTDEGAYRMRLCALHLWSGESPAEDRLLEWPDAAPVTYGKLAPAATAFLLVRLIRAPWIDLAHGELDEDLLALGARRLGRVLTCLAVLALAFAARRLGSGAPEEPAARAPALALQLAAGAAWTALALAPASDGGSVRASAWGLPLGALVLAGAGALTRRRELADQIVLAIATGLAAGLAFANDPFAWPLALAPLCALFFAARGEAATPVRDAVRGAVFFLATALFAGASRAPRDVPLAPRLDLLWQARAGSPAESWIDAAVLVLAAWLVHRRRAGRAHALLAVVLIASGALRMVDPRYAAAPLAPAGCALLLFTFEQWSARRGPRRAACGAGLLLVAVLGLASESATYSSAATLTLRELRRALPASGPWNHALARQDYALLANPHAAGMVAFHARRAVCGSALPGALPGARAPEAAAALLSESTAALAARALALGAPCVVVARRDLEQLEELEALAGRGPAEPGVRGAALRELLTQDSAPGFELVARTPATPEPGRLAELAVWRLPAAALEQPPASLRAR